MKLTALFVTLAAVVAGATLTEAATVDHAGPWSQIHDKDKIQHFRIYTEHSHADLRSAKPVYSKCVIAGNAAKKHDWEYFAKQSLLEFQQVGRHTVGINCPDCTPQELGNIYQTQLYFNCKVQDHRPADWKPKPVNHAGPWSQNHNQKALQQIEIFAEPSGADLRKATPVYSKCTYNSAAAESHDVDYFSKSNFLQFQQIGKDKLGVNCPNCTPQELGNLVTTKLYFDCAVQDHRPADWKPKGGK